MGGMCKEDFIETEVYVEYNFRDWLVSDLNDMRVDDRMIAMVKDDARIREESVVEAERQPVYPYHHGRVQTPLPGPVTITEKGVEQGQVIGVHPTKGNYAWRNLRNVLDWSGVGGVMETAQELKDDIK